MALNQRRHALLDLIRAVDSLDEAQCQVGNADVHDEFIHQSINIARERILGAIGTAAGTNAGTVR